MKDWNAPPAALLQPTHHTLPNISSLGALDARRRLLCLTGALVEREPNGVTPDGREAHRGAGAMRRGNVPAQLLAGHRGGALFVRRRAARVSGGQGHVCVRAREQAQPCCAPLTGRLLGRQGPPALPALGGSWMQRSPAPLSNAAAQ